MSLVARFCKSESKFLIWPLPSTSRETEKAVTLFPMTQDVQKIQTKKKVRKIFLSGFPTIQSKKKKKKMPRPNY